MIYFISKSCILFNYHILKYKILKLVTMIEINNKLTGFCVFPSSYIKCSCADNRRIKKKCEIN